MSTLEELLRQKAKAEDKLAGIKKRVGFNSGSRYGDELADSEFRVWTSYLEDIQRQIYELKKKK